MYFVHLWLPKAHVEAPVSGSIILAGVLLKLGGYGIIRLIRVTNIRIISSQIIALALIGGGILGVLCIVQRDIKVVIAYSSVVHIALVIAGRLRLTKWGFEGALIIILAHGVCSSGIFAAANMIYERRHSRRFFFNSGLLNRRAIFRIV
jgi:NADH-ubiquinone oxidoreductase chain 4